MHHFEWLNAQSETEAAQAGVQLRAGDAECGRGFDLVPLGAL